jgi:hypothetical protein
MLQVDIWDGDSLQMLSSASIPLSLLRADDHNLSSASLWFPSCDAAVGSSDQV